MSYPAPNISPSSVLMRYRLPIPLKIVLSLGVPVFLYMLYGQVFDPGMFVPGQDLEGWAFVIIYGSLLLFLYTNNSGYRIAWDDTRVYMREWGFRNLLFQRKRFHGIPYDEMLDMEGRFGNNAGAKSRFMPYEYLEITSSDPDESTIWIYPLSLNDKDLEEFLLHLHSKRPDIFPLEVLDLMQDLR